MRIWTLGVSVLVHGIAVAALIVAPLFATGALPAPRQLTKFIDIVPIEVPSSAPRAPRQAPVRPASRETFPTEEPPAVLPELANEPAADFSSAPETLPGNGHASGDGVIAAEPDPTVALPPSPPVRVGGIIVAPQKIHHVPPIYPALALAARKEGVVILEAIIGTDGMVQKVDVLRPVPLLDTAAVDAVRQWRFTPTLLNGVPVRVIMTVTVAFSLR